MYKGLTLGFQVVCNSFFFFLIYLFYLANYFTTLGWFLPCIDMNQLWVYMYSPHPEPLSHLPPHPIPLGRPSAPALRAWFHASNLDWSSVSHTVILHVSMLFSQIIPPSPSPTESKCLFFTSVSLLLSCIWGFHYHPSKFHIYALIHCTGVFLSGLLHSV